MPIPMFTNGPICMPPISVLNPWNNFCSTVFPFPIIIIVLVMICQIFIIINLVLPS